MTVITTESFVTYTGNGATVLFPFSFMIQTGADVVTIWDPITGSTVLNPSDYSITGLDNPAGGSITYPLVGSPLDAPKTITIQRVLAPVQETDISGQANFYTVVIEDALDYLTYLYQQLNFASERAVLLPVGYPGTGDQLLEDIFDASASASGSASAAAASASAAATSASNAATSEANALTSKNAAAASATAALASQTAAATSASNAATSEANALTSKNAAAASATAASGSASAAATSAANAATSESNALTSKNAAATSASNAATSETNAATSASNAAASATAAANAASSTLARSYRNIIRRNGGFELWQRGAGGAASFALAASAGSPYTADGWYLLNGANQACVVSQVAGIVNGSQWAAKWQRNAGQTGVTQINFGFPLDTDELYPLLGQFLRLSYTAVAGANWSSSSGLISGTVFYGTGTPVKLLGSFTGLTQLIAANANLTGTPVRVQGNSSIILPTNARQVSVVFTWSPVGTAGADDSVTIDDVQLEIVPAASGYVSSDFERLNFEEALLLCQRHFQKTFYYNTAPAQNAGTNTSELRAPAVIAAAGARAFLSTWWMPVKMRIAPTVTLYNPGSTNAQARDFTVAADLSATATAGVSENTIVVSATGNAGGAVGDICGIHIAADAGI